MSFAFFRKYNKIILAVGGSLLMVIFLIPQAASQFVGAAADRTVGRIGEREIKLTDLRNANAEMQLLVSLNPNVSNTIPQGNEASLRWLLMIEEARQQGLFGSSAQSQQLLSGWDVSAERLATLKSEFRADDAFIYQALRHWQMVMQLQRMLAPHRPSEQALRHLAADTRIHPALPASTVSVEVVPLHADLMIDQVDEPTEAELLDRFQLHRDKLPGQSEPFGFGYAHPNRVKLEYITVPLERVEQSITIDEVEANRYYLENTDQFIPEVEGALPDVDVPPLPYRDVRDKIIEQLTDEKTSEKMQRIVKTILAKLDETTRTYERDGESAFVKVGQLPDLEPIAEQIQQQYDVLPDINRIENRWIPVTEIGEIEGFGNAFLVIGSGNDRRGVPVAQYVNLVRELTPEDRNPLPALRLQVGLPSQAVGDMQGNRYIFRVLDTSPAQPAADLSEVREQVAQDVKKVKAYAMLKRKADDYLQSALEKGLEDFAATISEETQVRPIVDFSRREMNPQVATEPVVPNLPVVGRSEQFVDGVFNLVESIGEASLDDVPDDQRTAALPVDRNLSVYITRVTEYLPVTSEEFAMYRPYYASYLAQDNMFYVRRQGVNPLSLEALATRVGYTDADTDAQEDQPDDAPADDETAQ